MQCKQGIHKLEVIDDPTHRPSFAHSINASTIMHFGQSAGHSPDADTGTMFTVNANSLSRVPSTIIRHRIKGLDSMATMKSLVKSTKIPRGIKIKR